MSTYAAASSTHPLATQAIGEVLGSLLDDGLQFEPDFVFLSLSSHHRGSFEDVAKAVRHVLGPTLLLGQAGSGVIANGREFESTASIAAFAGNPGAATPIRLSARPAAGGVQLIGIDASELASSHSLLLLVDPSTIPLEGLLGHLGDRQSHLGTFGAAVSQSSRLLLDDAIYSDGAVGFLLRGDTKLSGFCASSVRPIGQPYTVTGVSDSFIQTLAGRPAIELFDETLSELQADSPLIQAEHLRIGIYASLTGSLDGPCLVRSLQRHNEHGLQVGTRVSTGSVVQFQLLDPTDATLELRSQLLGVTGEAALVFNSIQRGSGLFGEPHQDASAISEALDRRPTAGFSSALEITSAHGYPIAQQSSATAAVFAAR